MFSPKDTLLIVIGTLGGFLLLEVMLQLFYYFETAWLKIISLLF